MAPARRLVVRRLSNGKRLLLMDNYLINRGPGRVQFRGHRTARYRMDAVQIVDRSGGRTPLPVVTGARLTWKFVDYSRGSYWKFKDAARFEFWKLDATGHRTKVLRYGPKLDYCLRDLFRFGSGARVPGGPRFGACSQDLGATTDTLGISVGWADGYPYSYPQNWVNVTGKVGCFAIIHRADPLNHVLETSENDNLSHRVIRLPYRAGDQHCPRYRGLGVVKR
jgi:hypothetical protein